MKLLKKYQNRNLHLIVLLILIIFSFFACKKEKIKNYKIKNLENKTTYPGPISLSTDNQYTNNDYKYILNNIEINLKDNYDIKEAGFYELIIKDRNNNDTKDSIVFVILDSERGEPEWGLKPWTPEMPDYTLISNETIDVINFKNVAQGLQIPYIFKITGNNEFPQNVYSITNSVNDKTENIKNGIGAISLVFNEIINSIDFTIGDKNIGIELNLNGNNWDSLPSVIASEYIVNENSMIEITCNIEIFNSATLTIKEGCLIKIRKGINIMNKGNVRIIGKKENPVLFCCAESNNYWGGFINSGSNNSMEINYAIFTQSGYHDSEDYQYGHAMRQALFYLDQTEFNITNCYIINNIGQIFYSKSANLNLSKVYVNKAKTGGQLNSSQIDINNCIFSDFPNDNSLYQDEDNDCIYINACDGIISNSYFMYAKDDGIDSGGNDGGEITIKNCRFENIFHEGVAFSSANEVIKNHNVINCVFIGCGQGIELGFSSLNHTVKVDSCKLYYNNIGIRYGDNYGMLHNGEIIIMNTECINSYYKDIWNMCRENWEPKYNKMIFENSCISESNNKYPELLICL